VASGLYLGLNGSPSDGTRLVAVTTPVEWHIWHDEADHSTYRSVSALTASAPLADAHTSLVVSLYLSRPSIWIFTLKVAPSPVLPLPPGIPGRVFIRLGVLNEVRLVVPSIIPG
jgi:hypothetical protein